jgi:hypothetical protein
MRARRGSAERLGVVDPIAGAAWSDGAIEKRTPARRPSSALICT